MSNCRTLLDQPQRRSGWHMDGVARLRVRTCFQSPLGQRMPDRPSGVCSHMPMANQQPPPRRAHPFSAAQQDHLMRGCIRSPCAVPSTQPVTPSAGRSARRLVASHREFAFFANLDIAAACPNGRAVTASLNECCRTFTQEHLGFLAHTRKNFTRGRDVSHQSDCLTHEHAAFLRPSFSHSRQIMGRSAFPRLIGAP